MKKKCLIAKPWIDKILDVSTIHLSTGDAKLLEADAKLLPSDKKNACHDNSLIVHEYERGFFVYVSAYNTEQTRADFSPEFKAILAEARRRKCKWVCFDGDGEEYEGLEIFDW